MSCPFACLSFTSYARLLLTGATCAPLGLLVGLNRFDRCALRLPSPTFDKPLPKGLVKGRDGVVLPILGDGSIAFNAIVQGFEADSDLLCRHLEVIVPPPVSLLRVD